MTCFVRHSACSPLACASARSLSPSRIHSTTMFEYIDRQLVNICNHYNSTKASNNTSCNEMLKSAHTISLPMPSHLRHLLSPSPTQPPACAPHTKTSYVHCPTTAHGPLPLGFFPLAPLHAQAVADVLHNSFRAEWTRPRGPGRVPRRRPSTLILSPSTACVTLVACAGSGAAGDGVRTSTDSTTRHLAPGLYTWA
jgi:hypothetical protein